MFSKIFVVTLLFGAAYSRVLQVQNIASVPLVVSITGQDDVTVLPKTMVLVTVEEDFSGTISAIPSNAENADIPTTKVQLTLSPAGDSYAVSLIDGFNLKAKIVPIQGINCSAAVCFADLISKCPLENRVINSFNVTVACSNSPLVFRTICPRAVVSSEDVTKVLRCQAISYNIFLG
ncbi:hypothetical protein NQ318_008296 [Aromia moschata]|uniref:Uncharacterized protein n=1 Tax=Aromia moschata TaxID=1265417 RepID=A0AAV8Y536_9CUCU|nr:hypothetical protein NQ318_008296 [Aromia moschata]